MATAIDISGAPKACHRIVLGRPLIYRLMTRACKATAISRRELLTRSRKPDAWQARFAIMAVAGEQGRAAGQIGNLLGGLDHTSVLHGQKRAAVLERDDSDFAELMRILRLEARR